ncbi:MAG: hypothetical protein LBJ94_01010 [Puniceicoccales bacterium]|jgi:hypothetical protein|nr:hypothetical protein [Puniceicoccales bacterium]
MKVFAPIFLVLLCFRGAYGGYPSLCERSPFCTKCAEVVEKQPNVSDEFELHGVCLLGDECMFSILNKTSNGRCWLKLGETVAGISVKRYDKTRQTIELCRSDGSKLSIRLNQAEPRANSVRLAHGNSTAMPVSEEARRKFFEIVRNDSK